MRHPSGLSISFAALLLAIAFAGVGIAPAPAAADDIEKWGIFEAQFPGPAGGNPFVDVDFSADFRMADNSATVAGFYDGDGIYRVRFMPQSTGHWHYRTHSNRPELDGKEGEFDVRDPSPANHGPVRVQDRRHFAYADGSPYREIGTTCYVWAEQPPGVQQETLKTLASAPFNKLRMCVFPKWYNYNHNEPPSYPFVGTAPDKWDFTRFNPAYFRHIEQRVGDLRDLGIEADLILFHPYDDGHWGFDRMGADNDDRYVRYVVARLSAFRNVWWSLANEWDLCKAKTQQDFDRLGGLVQSSDPYNHLRSIHQNNKNFDHRRPWVTHVSLQSDRLEDAEKILATYRKPLIFDECKYEGDIASDWGNIAPQKMAASFWQTWITGAYCGHSETYGSPDNILWWSHGGVLHGQSPARISFFKQVIDAAPAAGVPLKDKHTWGVEGEYYLVYFWDHQPAAHVMTLPQGVRFKAEVIDTWEMTVTPEPALISGRAEIRLPRKPYQAIRVTAVHGK